MPHTRGVQREEPGPASVAAIAPIVGRWGVGSLVDARYPETGTVNQTILVTTVDGIR